MVIHNFKEQSSKFFMQQLRFVVKLSVCNCLEILEHFMVFGFTLKQYSSPPFKNKKGFLKRGVFLRCSVNLLDELRLHEV